MSLAFWRAGWPLAVCVCGLAVCPAGEAQADEFDTLNVNFGTNVISNDNVFYLPAGTDPNRVLGQPSGADKLTVNSVGLTLNKPYSLQRFELGVNFADYKYDRFNFLSFKSKNLNGAWRWSLTPRFHGNLTSNHSENLNTFVDFRSFVRNIRTEDNLRFDGEYEIDGVWRVIGAVANTKVQNEVTFVQQLDFRSSSAEAGVKYAFPSGSYASVVSRRTRGDYFKLGAPIVGSRFDNRYDQQDLEARFNWAFSGKSNFDSRIGYMKREHPVFAERNFSGVIGNAALTWNMTGKSRVVASFSRDLASFLGPSSSFTRMDKLSIGPVWEPGYKAVVRARYDVSTRAFLGPVAVTPANDRVDKMYTAYIGVDWQPRRFVTLSASLQNDKRSANQPGLDFNSTTASLSAQFTF